MGTVTKNIQFFVGAQQQRPLTKEDFSSFAGVFSGMNGSIRRVLLAVIKKNINEVLNVLRDGHTFFIEDGTTLEEMRRLGHPYSVQRPGEPAPDDTDRVKIHVQRSKGTHAAGVSIFDDIRAVPVVADKTIGIQITFGNENDALLWKFLRDGTKKMIPRPIDKEIAAFFFQGIDADVRQYMSKWFRDSSSRVNQNSLAFVETGEE